MLNSKHHNKHSLGKISEISGPVKQISLEDVMKTYTKEVVDCKNPDEREHGRNNTQHLIYKYLCTVEAGHKFDRVILDMINDSVHKIPDWDPGEASEAFVAIERYSLNLLDYPWKKEYKVLKLYGGFYECRVKKHLHNAIALFHLMGYLGKEGHLLKIQGPIDKQGIIKVAGECYVASIECTIMRQILERVRPINYDIKHVYQCRLERPGNVELSETWINQNCKPRRGDKPEPPKRSKKTTSQSRTNSRDSSTDSRDMNTVPPANGYNMFGTNNNNLAKINRSKDGVALKQRFASSMHEIKPRDDGLVNRGVSDDLTLSRNGMENIMKPLEIKTNSADTGLVSPSKDALYATPLQCDHVSTLSRGLQDLRLTGIEEKNYTHEEQHQQTSDMFAHGTFDDHMEKSLQYIQQEEEEKQHRSPGSGSRSGSQKSEDWRYVREGLTKQFGEQYFLGERGDILESNGIKEHAIIDNGKVPSSTKSAQIPNGDHKVAVDVHRPWTADHAESYDNLRKGGSDDLMRQSGHSQEEFPPATIKRRSKYGGACQVQAAEVENLYENVTKGPGGGELPAEVVVDGGTAAAAGGEEEDRLGEECDKVNMLHAVHQHPQFLPAYGSVASYAENRRPEFSTFRQPNENFDYNNKAWKSQQEVQRNHSQARMQELRKTQSAESPHSGRLVCQPGRRSCYDNVTLETDIDRVPQGVSLPSSPVYHKNLVHTSPGSQSYTGHTKTHGNTLASPMSSPGSKSVNIPSGGATASFNQGSLSPNIGMAKSKSAVGITTNPPVVTKNTMSTSASALHTKTKPAKDGSTFVSYIKEFENVETETLQNDPPNKGVIDYLTPSNLDNPKEKLVDLLETDGEKPVHWSCRHCTYTNDVPSEVCKACGKSFRRGAEDRPLHQGGPQCSGCTFVNEIGAKICGVCRKDLKGSSTYV